MNVSNGIKKSLFLSLSIAIIAPLYPNTTSVALEQEQGQEQGQPVEFTPDQQQMFLEQILRQYRGHLKTTDLILQDLLLLVSGRSVKVKNKEEFSHNVMALKDFIKSINEEAFLQIDPASLQLLGVITKSIMRHIISALDNHLVEFPLFDLEKIVSRHTPTQDITAEDLQNEVTRCGKIVETLSTKATSAGLRWYNKAYRAFDSAVIQPSIKHRIPIRAGIGLAAGFFAFDALFRSDSVGWGIIRNNFGWAPRFLGHGNQIDLAWHDKDHPIKNVGHAYRYLQEIYNGYAPLATLLWGAIMSYVIIERNTIATEVTKKAVTLHNRMKGGTYAEKPEEKFLFNPRVTFKDLVGLNHAKDTLSFLIKYLEDPERFDRAKLPPEKGYILTGPTRTGKSYLAEALAGEVKEMYKRQNKNPDDFNFFILTANFVITDGIDVIIERAKKYAPCILFIDEIDLLGLQRAGGNSELLSKFLSSMSGCVEADPDKVVIIIAATNKPETLDTALRQPGRFGKEIRFEYPTFEERKEFLVRRISSLANMSAFDIDKLARETEGQSFEKLNLMIKSAFQKGIITGEPLTQASLERALDEVVREVIMTDLSEISESEKRTLAVHQAGQALAVLLMDGNEKLTKVTIKPYLTKLKEESAWDQYYQTENDKQKKIKYGNTYTFHEHDIKDMHALKDKITQCKIKLAGFAAEELLLGSCGYSYHQDDAQFTLEVAKSIVSKGINLNQLPDDLKKEYYQKALKLQQEWAHEIQSMLVSYKDKLNKIADALVEKHILTAAEVASIAGLPYKEPYVAPQKTGILARELGIPEVAPAA